MKFSHLQEDTIRRYFLAGILIKGLISFAEIVVGTLALFIPVSTVTDAALHLAQNELIEEPSDFLATHFSTFIQHLSLPSGTFIALYLLSRGLIKFLLIIALLKNKLWAYPSSLAVLGVLVSYQIYQIITSFSPFLVALTLFDLIVMWTIWKEYQILRSHVQETLELSANTSDTHES